MVTPRHQRCRLRWLGYLTYVDLSGHKTVGEPALVDAVKLMKGSHFLHAQAYPPFQPEPEARQKPPKYYQGHEKYSQHPSHNHQNRRHHHHTYDAALLQQIHASSQHQQAWIPDPMLKHSSSSRYPLYYVRLSRWVANCVGWSTATISEDASVVILGLSQQCDIRSPEHRLIYAKTVLPFQLIKSVSYMNHYKMKGPISSDVSKRKRMYS